MDSPFPMRSRVWPAMLRHALVGVSLFFAYTLTGRLGLDYYASAGVATLFWPPIGIATAVLILAGLRFAPVVFAAAIVVNLAELQWPTAIGIAVGNTAAPMLAASILTRRGLSPRFPRRRDTVLFIVTASLAMGVSALNGSIWLLGSGVIESAQFTDVLAFWYFGDFAGVLLFAPLLLAAPTSFKEFLSACTWRAIRDTLLVLVLLMLIFSPTSPVGRWSMALTFIPMLTVIRVTALRGIWVAYVHIALLMVFVLGSVTAHVGPLDHLPPPIRMFVVWGYLFTVAVSALMTSGLLGEFRHTERHAREGDAHYRALVEDNPALICRFHVDGFLVFANETFRRVFGIDSGHTAGANFYQLSGLAGVKEFMLRMPEMRSTDSVLTADCRRATASGDRWFRWSCRVVHESSGRGVEFHAVGLDITEQKRAESDRRRIEREAVQVQKLESVGVLAGGIAHEFNNLLTAVLGNAELAHLELDGSHPVKPLLDDVRICAQRAAQLSQQLLDYAVRGGPGLGPLDLSEAVRSAKDLVGVAVPKRCRVQWELADGLPLVMADEVRVRQLLMSVVTNAGEAASETGGGVTIRTAAVHFDPARDVCRHFGDAPAGWYVVLQVEDRGNGFTTEAKRKLFQPFFSTRFPGRGLGLAAVLGIVRDHGGGIVICSRPGYGSAIRILFPAADPANAVMGSPSQYALHPGRCAFCETRVEAELPAAVR